MKSVQRPPRSTRGGHKAKKCCIYCSDVCHCQFEYMLLSVREGIHPHPSKLLHKDHLKKTSKMKSFKKGYFLIMWKRDSLSFETHQGCLCNFSHCQRGEKDVFPQLFPSSASPLKHMKSLNPPNGVLVTAVATYLRPRLRISEKWTVSIRGPVITQTFLQQSAGQRRWLGKQGHCRLWRRGTQIMPP